MTEIYQLAIRRADGRIVQWARLQNPRQLVQRGGVEFEPFDVGDVVVLLDRQRYGVKAGEFMTDYETVKQISSSFMGLIQCGRARLPIAMTHEKPDPAAPNNRGDIAAAPCIRPGRLARLVRWARLRLGIFGDE